MSLHYQKQGVGKVPLNERKGPPWEPEPPPIDVPPPSPLEPPSPGIPGTEPSPA